MEEFIDWPVIRFVSSCLCCLTLIKLLIPLTIRFRIKTLTSVFLLRCFKFGALQVSVLGPLYRVSSYILPFFFFTVDYFPITTCHLKSSFPSYIIRFKLRGKEHHTFSFMSEVQQAFPCLRNPKSPLQHTARQQQDSKTATYTPFL